MVTIESILVSNTITAAELESLLNLTASIVVIVADGTESKKNNAYFITELTGKKVVAKIETQDATISFKRQHIYAVLSRKICFKLAPASFIPITIIAIGVTVLESSSMLLTNLVIMTSPVEPSTHSSTSGFCAII